MSAGYPNLFAITGPQSPSVLTNIPVAIEQHVDWISGAIQYMLDNGLGVVEPTREAETSGSTTSQEVANARCSPSPPPGTWGRTSPASRRCFLPYLGGHRSLPAKVRRGRGERYEGFAFANNERDQRVIGTRFTPVSPRLVPNWPAPVALARGAGGRGEPSCRTCLQRLTST